MKINFENYSEDYICTLVENICVKSNIEDPDTIVQVYNWVNQLFVDKCLIQMVLKNQIKITGRDSNGEFYFDLIDEFQSSHPDKFPDENSSIWAEISEIIERKDNSEN